MRPQAALAGRSAGADEDARSWLVFALGAAAVLVALAAWRRNAYWNYSDGVYAATARELLHGAALYQEVAAAQPPVVYLVGAALLAIHDGPAAIRAGMGLVALATGWLVALAVWRLDERRWLAVGAGWLALVTPWTVHEHGQLTPETLGAPLILGAALLASRPRGATLAGALGALAVACKLPFAIPALLVALAAARPRRALAAFTASAATLAVAGTVAFGAALWRGILVAQLQVGTHALHYVGGLWLQAGWNLAPLSAGAAAALMLHRRARDPRLLATTAAAALGSVALLVTLYKDGTYLNVIALAEPPLIALAAPGTAWLFGQARDRGPAARTALGVTVALVALGVVQVLSLLVSPQDPRRFARPLSATSPRWLLSPSGVDAARAAARRCPRGVAYSGPPYLAFVAGRRMPGGQPDQFIVSHAREHAAFARLVVRERHRCP